MLLSSDIEDLKNYLNLFDRYCENHVCDDSCEVWTQKLSSVSCFKTFVQIQKNNL